MNHPSVRYHWLGMALGVAGLGVILGWWLGVDPLTTMLPGWPSMKPNTALAFLLSGTALWCLQRNEGIARESGWCQAGFACALMVAGIGALTLVEHLGALDLGIDQLLWRDALSPGENAMPGRMAPATALGFTLSGIALALLHRGRRWVLAQALLVAVAALFALPLVSDLYAGPAIRAHHFFSSVALHTDLLFLLLAAAGLAARADRGFMALAGGSGPGAQTIRHLLPPSLLLLVTLGWLEARGWRAGLFPAELGTALLVVAAVLLLGLLVWRLARRLAEMDGALREQERSLAIALQSVGAAVLTTDAAGRVTRLNPVAERLTGWKAAEAVGRPAAEVFRVINETTRRPVGLPGPEVLDRLALHPLAQRSVLVSRDGTERPIADSYAPLRGPGGGLTGLVVGFSDATERTQAQAALERSTAEVDELYNNAPCGYQSLDPDGRFVAVNDTELAWLGYQRDELVQKLHFSDLLSEESRSWFAEKFQQLKSRGEIAKEEFEVVRKDGKRMSILLNASAIYDDHGNFLRSRSTLFDITERKQKEAQIRELNQNLETLVQERTAELLASQKRFSDLFEYAPDAIFIVRAGGTIAMVNRQTESLFGYQREELVGQTVECLMPEAMRRRHESHRDRFHQQASARAMGAGLPELPALKKDGTTFPAEISLSPFTSQDGTMMVMATVRDISDRVRATKALERANATIEAERAQLAARVEARTAELSEANRALTEAVRARENFLATMSHEIRTPLNGLLGMLELLSLTPLSHEQKNELEIASNSGRSLGRIINDILDYSKMEAGKLDIHPQAESLARVVEGVRNAYLGSASGKALTLTCEVDPRIRPALNFDALRLSQVLNNLVSNAIKFTHDGGVSIRAELLGQDEAGDTVRIAVTDTGAGIAADAQARLFQPYEQAHAGIERLHGGTGLGLAICWRLTEMMGGEISLDSTPGEGTTLSVVLTFPVADEAALPRAEPPALDTTPLAGGGLPILVVDDHPTNRTLMARQLGNLGLKAELAEDGAAALARWRKTAYAMVVTDVHMPEMDGYALTAAIRESEAREGRARTPIIAWTAKAFAEDVERCRAAGMDDYLVKPTELGALRQALTRWLPAAKLTPVPTSSEGASTRFLGDDASPLDRAELALLSGCPDEQAEILRDFESQTVKDLADLRAALDREDLTATTRLAHRMKGASRMVGAQDLAARCESLEQAARAGRRERVAPLFEDLEVAVARFADHLKSETGNDAEAPAVHDDEPPRQALPSGFQSAGRRLAEEIREACGRRDSATVAKAARRLEAAAHAAGTPQLAAASDALERTACQDDWDRIASAHDAFEAAWARFESSGVRER